MTVMFCDMEGYSRLSEKLGIEEAYEIMDQVYEILIHKVHDYGGTVNEMTGDGIMALFGAPLALEFLFKGREFSTKFDHHWWRPCSNLFLGAVHFEIGKYQIARDFYEEAASLFIRYGNWPSHLAVSQLGSARAQLYNDEEDVNLEAIYGYLSIPKAKVVEGWVRRYISEILLKIDAERISEAEKWIKEAIAADERNGMLFELAKDYLTVVEILKQKETKTQASENLQKAIEIFRKCGADGWVEKYE